ncbi:hypothetical protein BJ875DRAFT_524152 [Amylocarpus encephaloides]|uniref:Uncharacterized protein n=1 Tax=Amylocarpus encephaloides TaxID=45428 RepID=A0A9P7Y9D6_9HELO|nr:hypothetical protein BJ875DRAFT_524152 [Amylocarpus encephaloides]
MSSILLIGYYYLIRLGRTSRFEKKLKFYDLRRALEKRLKDLKDYSFPTIKLAKETKWFEKHKTDIITPPTFKYELEERDKVTKLLFKPLNGLTEDQILEVRVELVNNLIRLYDEEEEEEEEEDISQGETDVESDVDWETKTLPDEDSDADSIAPMEVEEQPVAPTLYCAFCKWVDEEAGPRKRDHVFSRINSLGRHIRAQYLCPRAAGEGFDYSY